MDVTQPITYRGFEFNTVTLLEGAVASGCTVERVEYGDVEVVGYTEKRSLDDGHDASDVFLGRRSLVLHGVMYGKTRGALYDLVRNMRFTISPRLAYRDAPEAKGFYPLEFREPTAQVADWPTGYIDLMLRVRSTGGVNVQFSRDAHGGDISKPISVPYSVGFIAKDPRVYLRNPAKEFIQGSAGNLQLENRGGHPVPLNMLLVAEANPTQVRIFDFVGGGADFNVRFPASDEVQVLRLDGEKKVVTLQVNEKELLRQDLRSLNAAWPELPLGLTDVAWTFKRANGVDASLNQNSVLWHREAFS